MTRIKKIALEEHFMGPDFEQYSQVFLNNIPSEQRHNLSSRLADFDDQRLAEMDEFGIDLVILSQSGPSVQGEHNARLAVEKAQANNDFLAERIARHPNRYAGFATLAMQNPDAACQELIRAVEELGFKGALINGHTQGIYLDDPQYEAFWATVERLGMPIYLHPTNFFQTPHIMADMPVLAGAVWGWGVETGSHALRLLFSGVFDRYPRLKLVLGHMGEGLPFMRWRFDSRFAVYAQGLQLQKQPSEYIGTNIVITTSGVCSAPTLMAAIGEMGPEAVMFSVDYPYESTQLACEFIEQAPMDDVTRQLVCYENARKLFQL